MASDLMEPLALIFLAVCLTRWMSQVLHQLKSINRKLSVPPGTVQTEHPHKTLETLE